MRSLKWTIPLLALALCNEYTVLECRMENMYNQSHPLDVQSVCLA